VLEEDLTCAICTVTRDAAQLERCRNCRRTYCGDCSVRSRSGTFCSQECADLFYFGDDDDESTESDD
jgi:hypothetical protein